MGRIKPEPDAADWKKAVEIAVLLVAEHPEVVRVSALSPDDEGAQLTIDAEVTVELPLAWKARGVSPNGGRSIEPVRFSFSQNFPFHAPKITLRDDFDRSLAHVQPGSVEGPVEPCLYDGDLDELMHSRGLPALVDNLVEWLVRAALGKLIDREQGWEPVRRDQLDDTVIADASALRAFVTRHEEHAFLEFDYLRFKPSRSPNDLRKDFFYHGCIGSTRIALSPKTLEERGHFQERRWRDRVAVGRSVAIIVTPGRLSSGALHIAGTYRPDTVTNLSELKARAAEYGCGKAMDASLRWLRKCVKGFKSDSATFPLAIVLCARRPFHLINETSDIELVPYLVPIAAPDLFPEGDAVPVYAAGHRHGITPGLLKRMSGQTTISNDSRNWVLVGCGSLGSKIAVHMARSGAAPQIVIDRRNLSPHNAARHALLPKDDKLDLTWTDAKADALGKAIGGFGQTVQAHTDDVISVVRDKATGRRLLPRRAWAVLDTTGSLPVRSALAAINPSRPNWRVVETGLLAQGTIGLISVEGPKRNPNCEDLGAEVYRVMREREALRRKVFEDGHAVSRQAIGEGCGSMTMVMPDAQLSVFAAAMSQYFLRLRREGFREDVGRVVIGTIGDDGMSLSWETQSIPPVVVVPTENDTGWTVRLAQRAHEVIVGECAAFPDVETGGVLMGRLSESQRAFLVTDVLPAPGDSTRSASEFTLGVRGVRRMVDDYASSCRGALYCLGTWHSHLSEAGPSDIDRRTAATLAVARALPCVLLIRTPTAYKAVVASRKTASLKEGEG